MYCMQIVPMWCSMHTEVEEYCVDIVPVWCSMYELYWIMLTYEKFKQWKKQMASDHSISEYLLFSLVFSALLPVDI